LIELVRKSDAPSKAIQAGRNESTSPAANMGSPVGDAVPSASAEMSGLHRALYQAGRKELAQILEAARGAKPLEVGALRRVVAGMVDALAIGDGLQVLTLGVGDTILDLPAHMVNVAIFAVKIGQGLGYGRDELRRLALAASLHDVGMLAVPQRILEKPGALSPDELTLVREHPKKGSRILQALGPEYDWVATVALQEHEREDGSGYPGGLKMDGIHEHAKIVGLADSYEALTRPRPYQKQRAPFDALKEVTGRSQHLFAHNVLKGFIQGLSAYPVGSLVRLNSGEVARVVATHPALPLRPVVEVLTGSLGEQLRSPRRVDLTQNSLLYVTESLTSDAVRDGEGA
jgi:HD-GYP domain-containing protein (c-di-GMP phosphodiesterase class II)